jgi:hypothetical protein
MQPSVQPAELLIEFALSQRDFRWIDAAFVRVGRDIPQTMSANEWASAPASVTDVRAWRDAAKRQFDAGPDFSDRCGALFVYAWCVAVSVVQHGVTGSSERRDSIDGLLGAAASIAPASLRETIEAAITRETPD